jgi:hypothetical protein
MPRFSIKDLMLGITLVAIGLAVDFAAVRYPWYPPPPGVRPGTVVMIISVAFGVGAAFIGAGALAPFHKKAIGAVIGFALAAPLFFMCRMGPSV